MEWLGIIGPVTALLVKRPNGDYEQITLVNSKQAGYNYLPFQCSDGGIRYALLGKSTDANASHLWVEQNGVKRYCIKSPDVGEAVILTMGNYSTMYGYSRYNSNFGEITGTPSYNGKNVTIILFSYSSYYFDFAFRITGETSGAYDVTVILTNVDTGEEDSISLSNIQYQTSMSAFYSYKLALNGTFPTFFLRIM